MNRRSFLKSIAAACGAAVVCPGELLKSPVKYLWMRGKNGSCIGEKLIHRNIIITGERGKVLNWIHYSIPIYYQDKLPT